MNLKSLPISKPTQLESETIAQWTASNIEVLSAFDGGVCPRYRIIKKTNTIAFYTGKEQVNLHVFLRNVPKGLVVEIYPTIENNNQFVSTYQKQGLYVGSDGECFDLVDFKEKDDVNPVRLSLELNQEGNVWISTNIIYGRNDLDQLLIDTRSLSELKVIALKKSRRLAPVFQIGDDDGKKLVHYGNF